jgi:hypothetical protein
MEIIYLLAGVLLILGIVTTLNEESAKSKG